MQFASSFDMDTWICFIVQNWNRFYSLLSWQITFFSNAIKPNLSWVVNVTYAIRYIKIYMLCSLKKCDIIWNKTAIIWLHMYFFCWYVLSLLIHIIIVIQNKIYVYNVWNIVIKNITAYLQDSTRICCALSVFRDMLC